MMQMASKRSGKTSTKTLDNTEDKSNLEYIPPQKMRIMCCFASKEILAAFGVDDKEFTLELEVPAKTTPEALLKILGDRYPQLAEVIPKTTVKIDGVTPGGINFYTLNEGDKVTV
mmetsp:Transcript_19334/g.21512  ORF Transcript_19334/g.21512 Transcript_19334/m.21512 type:complete len:115 (-) Transcript_19334:134-478(-)